MNRPYFVINDVATNTVIASFFPEDGVSYTGFVVTPGTNTKSNLTILAEEEITLQKDAFVEGNIHSNEDAELKKRSDLRGNVTASEEIELHKDAEIAGDVTAPDINDRGADIGGTVTEDDVDPIPFPALPPITPGSDDIEIAKGETLDLAPGMYRNIKLQDDATLNLAYDSGNGDYHIREIRIGKRATVNLDATGGTETPKTVELLTLDEGDLLMNAGAAVPKHLSWLRTSRIPSIPQPPLNSACRKHRMSR